MYIKGKILGICTAACAAVFVGTAVAAWYADSSEYVFSGNVTVEDSVRNSLDLLALLAGRFLAFVRTLLPTMAGISGLPNRRFQFFNWLSGLLWVSVVTSFGYALSMIPFVKRHEDQVMTFLMILPIALLTAGLLGTLFVVIKKKYCNA